MNLLSLLSSEEKGSVKNIKLYIHSMSKMNDCI